MTSPGDAPPPAPEDPAAETRTSADPFGRLGSGELLAGRYRVEGVLGVGGMGIVYRARDEELDVAVAIKVLRPELADRHPFVDRFRRELLLARQVSHRNVVRIHDLGQHGACYFLSMDLVEGRSLREILDRDGALGTERSLDILRQLAEALSAAHREGVVHRDLKPANVLLDENGNAFITDFGVARSLHEAGLTQSGAVVGTPDYLSPEQARGEEVGPRSDLYSLGLILFEMLTGRLPFRGGSPTELVAQRLAGAPLRRIGEQRGLSRSVRALLRGCLETEPERRYGSADELLADLKRAPRRRGVSRRVTVVAAAFVGGAALWWWVAVREPGAPAGAGLRHGVAVLPLADETGRPDLAWVARAVPELLARALSESPELRVAEPLRVFRTLEDLRVGPSGGPSGITTLSELLEADRLVVGTVRAPSGQLRLEVELLAAGEEVRVLARHGAEAGVDDLSEAVGALRRALVADLRAGRGGGALAGASPAALRPYVAGVEHLSRGQTLQAIPFLEEAVEADPAFTQAWVRLSQACDESGLVERAMQAARRAVEAAGRPDGRTALEARGGSALVAGRFEEAQEIFGVLAARYPHDLEARLSLAQAFGEAGQLPEAIAGLREVAALAPRQPRAWFLLAKYSILMGESRKAIDEYLVHALVLNNRLGSRQGRADVLNALGVAHEDLGDPQAAEEHFRQAAQIREEIGDTRGLASTLRNLAAIHSVRGRPEEASVELDRAQDLLEGIGDRRGLADLLNDRGLFEEETGRYGEALDLYRRALQLRRELGDLRSLAESLNNVGFVYYLLGEYDNARVYWDQALDSYQRAGNREGVLLSRQGIGSLQLAQGQWDAALKSFHAALEESRALELRDTMAVSLGYMGRVAHLQGRFDAAFSSYREALGILEELEDPRGLAEFTLLEADALLDLGLLEAASERLARAAEWLEEGGNRAQRAQLLELEGKLLLRRDLGARAAEVLARAVAEGEASHSLSASLGARIESALADLARGSTSRAERALRAALAEATRVQHAALELRAAEALGRTLLADRRVDEAAAVLEPALRRVESLGGYAGSYRLRLHLARALGPETPEGARQLDLAGQEVESLRGGLDAEQIPSFDTLPEVREIGETRHAA